MEAASLGRNTVGIVAGIGACILFVGAIVIVTVILWRYYLHRARNKRKEINHILKYNHYKLSMY